MSDLLRTENIGLYFPLIVFGVSLLGSWHCAGMCSSLVCYLDLKGQKMLYHWGRGVSYTTGGALLGGLGAIPESTGEKWLGLIIIVTVMALFYFSSSKKYPLVLQRIVRWTQFNGFIIGIFTALLPCAWLWSFLFVASQSQSAWLGASIMFFFFLGTLPVLVWVPGFLHELYRSHSLRRQAWVRRILWLGSVVLLTGHLFLHSLQ